jgi:hypothetical protein
MFLIVRQLFCLQELDDAEPDAEAVLDGGHEGGGILRQVWDNPGAYPRSRPVGQSQPQPQQLQSNDHDAALSSTWSFVLDELPMGGQAAGEVPLRRGGAAVLYPSAMEAATSAMEVMAVAARNAALLTAQIWAEGKQQQQDEDKATAASDGRAGHHDEAR